MPTKCETLFWVTVVNMTDMFMKKRPLMPPWHLYSKGQVINSTVFILLFVISEFITRDPLKLFSIFKNPCLTTFQRSEILLTLYWFFCL